MSSPTQSDKTSEEIVSEFIGLKFDVDTDEFSDGTLSRWNNMLAALTAREQRLVQEADRMRAYANHFKQLYIDEHGYEAYRAEYEAVEAQLTQDTAKKKED